MKIIDSEKTNKCEPAVRSSEDVYGPNAIPSGLDGGAKSDLFGPFSTDVPGKIS